MVTDAYVEELHFGRAFQEFLILLEPGLTVSLVFWTVVSLLDEER